MLNLQEFRGKEKSYADLLGYAAMIDDGVMLQKDGSLLAGWYYRGEDLASASKVELQQMALRVNAVISRLGSGWILQTSTLRLPAVEYPTSTFPDRTTREIERERKTQYQEEGSHYDTAMALTLTYMPPLTVEQRFTESMVQRADTGTTEKPADRILRQFNEALSNIESNLKSVLTLTRMRLNKNTGADELLRYLHYSATGKNHAVRLPETPMYLDCVIASEDFFGGWEPRVGSKHVRVLSITGLPAETQPAMLDALGHMQFPMRWTSRFIFLDPSKAAARIDKMRKKWKQGVRGFKDQMFRTAGGPVNLDALQQSQDAEIALSEAKSGQVRFGYYTSTIVLMDEDIERVDANAKEVLRILGDMMLTARIETVNSVEAFLGSLPGNGMANVRRSIIHSLNLAHLMPLTAVWSGPTLNPCPFYKQPSPPLFYATTTGGTPFRFVLHVGDLGHSLFLGPTGAGKSTLLGLVAAQHLRYESPDGKPAQVIFFDKGNSALPLTAASGGQHFEVGADGSPLKFAPLTDIDSDAELLWAQDWLEVMLILQKVVINPAVRTALTTALRRMRTSPKDKRSLSEFIGNLQDQALRDAISQYTSEGPSDILDAQVDGLAADADRDGINTFEMEHLLSKGETIVVPTLLYLFHRVEQRLDGRPTLLILDEAWVAIQNPVFAAKIKEWLKVLRKANCAVIFATQSLSDIANSSLKDVLIESCPTKVFLANPEANTENVRSLYTGFGLTARQIDIVAGMTRQRQYYVIKPDGKRVIDLTLGPVALSFIGASGKEDLIAVKQMMKAYGDMWPAEWLRSRGLEDAAQSWMG